MKDWAATVPTAGGALSWGVAIHRFVEPRDWNKAIARVPESLRADAETYLRGIAQRMRVARATKAGIHA